MFATMAGLLCPFYHEILHCIIQKYTVEVNKYASGILYFYFLSVSSIFRYFHPFYTLFAAFFFVNENCPLFVGFCIQFLHYTDPRPNCLQYRQCSSECAETLSLKGREQRNDDDDNNNNSTESMQRGQHKTDGF